MLDDEPQERPDDLDAEFATWWLQVPKKTAKATAHRAYRTARKKATAEQLLAGILRYAAEIQVKGTEPRFIAHPATWLNGERWLDEPPPNVTPIRPGAQATSPTMAAFADLYDDTPEAASERARFRL
ncbi:hypothetical protein [Azospirillum sp. TSO22-1]|uniref:hypothetical protein n=1 Tax=Azospirillum sp. TSO22-1 TaxID=716789 RepID=UPI000D652523|nr:hypothetical protein [Azospirillum sp. TSO22-1]